MEGFLGDTPDERCRKLHTLTFTEKELHAKFNHWTQLLDALSDPWRRGKYHFNPKRYPALSACQMAELCSNSYKNYQQAAQKLIDSLTGDNFVENILAPSKMKIYFRPIEFFTVLVLQVLALPKIISYLMPNGFLLNTLRTPDISTFTNDTFSTLIEDQEKNIIKIERIVSTRQHYTIITLAFYLLIIAADYLNNNLEPEPFSIAMALSVMGYLINSAKDSLAEHPPKKDTKENNHLLYVFSRPGYD